MTIGTPILLGVLLGAAPTHGASARAAEPEPGAQRLGIAEAMTVYCTKADPPAAGKFREAAKQMIKGRSKTALTEMRRSDAYRRAFQSVVQFSAKIDEHNARRFCGQNLPPSR